MSLKARVTVQEARREVGRELGMRRKVYRRWVESGRMGQQDANHRRLAMAAAYALLGELDGDQCVDVEIDS